VLALKVPVLYALAIPVGFSVHAAMLVANWQKKKNRTITWKGRTFE
jgi:hypothetical protein